MENKEIELLPAILKKNEEKKSLFEYALRLFSKAVAEKLWYINMEYKKE